MADAAGDDLDALGDPAQFEALEADFDSVLSELGADGTLEQFKLEYETLFRALKKSNESEKRLMKKCRELSADIGAASAKCAAATKLSGEDQEMIQQLKKDIERTWASVEASHEKEAAAKAQLAELRGEIDTLRRSVEQGAGSSVAQEGRLRELAATRDELCRERDAQAQQVQQARSIIAELAEKLRTLEGKKAAAEAAATEQTAAIEQRTLEGEKAAAEAAVTEQAAAIEQKKVDSLLSIDAAATPSTWCATARPTAAGGATSTWPSGSARSGRARAATRAARRARRRHPEPLTRRRRPLRAACCATPPTASSSWRTTARACAWRSSRR